MERKLLEAGVYRKFLFGSKEDLDHYMNSGHQARWIVDVKERPHGIVAIIGESYNNCHKLMLREN